MTGSPLPARLRAAMEPLFGVDFSEVRVHESLEPQHFGALAFARGIDIYFQPGLNLHSPQGMHLIGHELAHVAQQLRGRALGRTAEADLWLDARAEREADTAGWLAATGNRTPTVFDCAAPYGVTQCILQDLVLPQESEHNQYLISGNSLLRLAQTVVDAVWSQPGRTARRGSKSSPHQPMTADAWRDVVSITRDRIDDQFYEIGGRLIQFHKRNGYISDCDPDRWHADADGATYKEFAQQIEGIVRRAEGSNTTIATGIRKCLMGGVPRPKDKSADPVRPLETVVPALTAVLFIAEPVRFSRWFLTHLIMLDLVEADVFDAADVDRPFDWMTLLADPVSWDIRNARPRRNPPAQHDMYGQEIGRPDITSAGASPATAGGAVSRTRPAPASGTLNLAEQKEVVLLIRWLYSRYPSMFGFVRSPGSRGRDHRNAARRPLYLPDTFVVRGAGINWEALYTSNRIPGAERAAFRAEIEALETDLRQSVSLIRNELTYRIDHLTRMR